MSSDALCRDFRETSILVDFKNSLELALRNQLTDSALYMGTNLYVFRFLLYTVSELYV